MCSFSAPLHVSTLAFSSSSFPYFAMTCGTCLMHGLASSSPCSSMSGLSFVFGCHPTSLPLLNVIVLTCSFGLTTMLLGRISTLSLVRMLAIYSTWTSKFWIEALWFWSIYSLFCYICSLFYMKSMNISLRPSFLSCCPKFYGGLAAPCVLLHEMLGWFLHPRLYVFEYGLSYW